MRRPPIHSRTAHRDPTLPSGAADPAAVHGSDARPAALPLPPSPALSQHGASPPAPHPWPTDPSEPSPPWQTHLLRRTRWLTGAVAVLSVLSCALLADRLLPREHALNAREVQALLQQGLRNHTPPALAAVATERVLPSVVHISSLGPAHRGRVPQELAEGSGVVLQSSGVVLTNWHVVQHADAIRITFADGTESPATLLKKVPEKDLAVLQAQRVPDDLQPATLGNPAQMRLGDPVVVVGYPFGIGPSVSAGVLSGTDRVYRSPQAGQQLERLMQFDAAANPGNSGGPLVNATGEVVGIVTAILNPNQQGTFVGIGFAMPIDEAASAAGQAPF